VDLLKELPDVPRWVEARGMLLSGRGAIVGDQARPTIVAAADSALGVVVNWSNPTRLAQALNALPPEFTLVAPAEAETLLRELTPARASDGATLFTLPRQAEAQLPMADPRARLLRPSDLGLLERLPPALRGELKHAFEYTVIAATFIDEQPVSFCYAGWETETLWDVSVDTLRRWRRQGLAYAAAVRLLHHHRARRKAPVWGAADANVASSALARRLGFEPVDRLVLFYGDARHSTTAPSPYSSNRIGRESVQPRAGRGAGPA
jgi:RimJ/RimL family protein N-acetyltransferase